MAEWRQDRDPGLWPLYHLSLTWVTRLCSILKCSWGISHRHIRKSIHRLCTPISRQVFLTPQQPLCSSLLWWHIFCPGMCFSDYAMSFQLVFATLLQNPYKTQTSGMQAKSRGWTFACVMVNLDCWWDLEPPLWKRISWHACEGSSRLRLIEVNAP